MTDRTRAALDQLASRNPVPVESLGDSWDTSESRRVLSEIVTHDRVAELAPKDGRPTRYRPPDAPPHRRVRRVFTAVVVMVCTVVVAGVVLVTSVHLAGPSSSWELVDAVGLPYRSLDAGVANYNLQCVSNTVCYSYGGPTSLGNPWLLARTTDGGATWSEVHVPVAQGASASDFMLSCSGARTCVALRREFSPSGGAAELAITTNGGDGWTTRTVPHPSGSSASVMGFVCTDENHCLAVFEDNAFLSTTDGGRTWTQAQGVPVVAGEFWRMACSADGSCVAVYLTAGPGPLAHSVTALRSSDGGRTWVEGPSAPVSQLGPIVYASCSGGEQCMLVSVGGPRTRPFEIISTDDAGRSWSMSGPPKGWSNMPTAVSCATPTNCWIAMSSYGAKGAAAYSHPLIEATSDGGRTWVASKLPTTTPPLSDINTLSCPPSGDGCMGIGTGQDHFVLPTRKGSKPRAHLRRLSPPLVISNLPR